MAITYGFYNSVGGDRTYDALDMGKMFDGVIGDGVFELVGDKLETTDGSGMVVIVGSGKAWFNHTWTTNDAALNFTLDDSDLILPRIDTIILEVDSSNAVRANTIKVLTGTPASVPSPATLTNTSEVHQYPLAYIQVDAGVSEIVAADIDVIVGTYLCPFVTFPGAGGGTGADVLEVQVFS